MGSLSKEKNLIFGLLLGMVIAVATHYAQPSEARASQADQVERDEQIIRRILGCIDQSVVQQQFAADSGRWIFYVNCRS